MKKFIPISIVSILISLTIFSQSSGDYRSVSSGNWNDPTKWEAYNGSSWITASTYPGQNPGTGAVTIKIFHELKLTATVPNSIASLLIDQFNDYPAEGVIVSQNGIVVFSSENSASLTVSGDVAIHGELKIDDQNGTNTHTLFVGGGFEIGTPIYDECSLVEMIPATFQTINHDDKLSVVFNGSTWINTGPVGITFQDVTFDGTGFSVTYPVYIKGNATFINGIVLISHSQGFSNCTIGSGFTGDMIFYDGATVSGASNASFVDGWIYKWGDDPFTFPIGHENVYAPLSISAPPSQSASVRAYYQRSNASDIGAISDPGLFNVSNCEVWTLDQGLNNNLDVTVSWSAASGCGSSPYITNVSEVTLARLGSSPQAWASHGGSGMGTTTNGSVTMSGVNSYGTFTLGNLGACNAAWANVTNISSNSATISWPAVNGAISYDVDYKPYTSSEWISAAMATTSTSVNLSGLIAGMSFDWRIRTNCGSSLSSYRQSQFATPCDPILGTSTTNITSSSATLNWIAVPNITTYRVDYKQSTSTTWIRASMVYSLSYTLAGLIANTAYDWRVHTVCNGSYLGSPVQSSFTTLQAPPPPPPVCNDIYEINNTSNQAKTINIGSAISAGISSTNDVDWFKVTTPNNANTNLEITLSSLPADYDLYVYDKRLKLVGSSVNTGTANETVIYNSNARKATYYIKVVGKDGALNTSQCYNLLAQVSGIAGSASGKSYPANEVNDISDRQLLYPNPASEFVMLQFNSIDEGPVNVQIFNTAGQLVKLSAIKITKGYNQVKIAVNNVNQGFYYLRINKGELNIIEKFVIAR